jgi:hypothetical protein
VDCEGKAEQMGGQASEAVSWQGWGTGKFAIECEVLRPGSPLLYSLDCRNHALIICVRAGNSLHMSCDVAPVSSVHVPPGHLTTGPVVGAGVLVGSKAAVATPPAQHECMQRQQQQQQPVQQSAGLQGYVCAVFDA